MKLHQQNSICSLNLLWHNHHPIALSPHQATHAHRGGHVHLCPGHFGSAAAAIAQNQNFGFVNACWCSECHRQLQFRGDEHKADPQPCPEPSPWCGIGICHTPVPTGWTEGWAEGWTEPIFLFLFLFLSCGGCYGVCIWQPWGAAMAFPCSQAAPVMLDPRCHCSQSH